MSWKKTPILLLRSSKSICNGIMPLYAISQISHLGLGNLVHLLYIDGCMFFCYVDRHIKTLRMKIAEVHSQWEETEKQLKKKKFSSSKVQKKIEKVQTKYKVNLQN